MTSYIKVCEIFPKNILQIKRKQKVYLHIYNIFVSAALPDGWREAR